MSKNNKIQNDFLHIKMYPLLKQLTPRQFIKSQPEMIEEINKLFNPKDMMQFVRNKKIACGKYEAQTSENHIQKVIIKKITKRVKPSRIIVEDGKEYIEEKSEEITTQEAKVRLYWKSDIAKNVEQDITDELKSIRNEREKLRELYDQRLVSAKEAIEDLSMTRSKIETFQKFYQVNENYLVDLLNDILEEQRNGNFKATRVVTIKDPKRGDVIYKNEYDLLTEKLKELLDLKEKINRQITAGLYHINNNEYEILEKHNNQLVKLQDRALKLMMQMKAAIDIDNALVESNKIHEIKDVDNIDNMNKEDIKQALLSELSNDKSLMNEIKELL
jgi:hypothetical protein